MFKRRRPCGDCPFKRGMGSRFRLMPDRLDEIFRAPAFQCHQTVDYDNFDDPDARQGKRPQQCAGLMGLLFQEGWENQIMQVAERLGAFDPRQLKLDDCYSSFDEARRAHAGKEP